MGIFPLKSPQPKYWEDVSPGPASPAGLTPVSVQLSVCELMPGGLNPRGRPTVDNPLVMEFLALRRIGVLPPLAAVCAR